MYLVIGVVGLEGGYFAVRLPLQVEAGSTTCALFPILRAIDISAQGSAQVLRAHSVSQHLFQVGENADLQRAASSGLYGKGLRPAGDQPFNGGRRRGGILHFTLGIFRAKRRQARNLRLISSPC
jgi:hypothetical protein